MSLGYFVDIQGTLLSDKDKSPLKGAIELIDYFNDKNIPYALVTNNTKQLSDELVSELFKKGFNFDRKNFIDPLMVLKDLVKKSTVFPFGSEQFCSILPKLGFEIDKKNPDIILVASYDKFNSLSFANMIEMVVNGAKPIGMHATSTYVKNGYRYPGVGAIMAMIEYATGEKFQIVGKPSSTFYQEAFKILKNLNKGLNLEDITMISDDGIGDLAGAKDLRISTNLVLSGKCKSANEVKSIKDKIDKIYSGVDEILKEIM